MRGDGLDRHLALAHGLGRSARDLVLGAVIEGHRERLAAVRGLRQRIFEHGDNIGRE